MINYKVTVNCPYCFAKIPYEARNCMHCSNSLSGVRNEMDSQAENVITIINEIKAFVGDSLIEYYQKKAEYLNNQSIEEAYRPYSFLIFFSIAILSPLVVYFLTINNVDCIPYTLTAGGVGFGVAFIIAFSYLQSKGYNNKIFEPKFPFKNFSEKSETIDIVRCIIIESFGLLDQQTGKLIIDAETITSRYNNIKPTVTF